MKELSDRLNRRQVLQAFAVSFLPVLPAENLHTAYQQEEAETLPPDFWDNIASELQQNSIYKETIPLSQAKDIFGAIATDASVVGPIDIDEVMVADDGSWTLTATAMAQTVKIAVANNPEKEGSLLLVSCDAGNTFFVSGQIESFITSVMNDPNERAEIFLNKRFAEHEVTVSNVRFFLETDAMRIEITSD